MLVRTNSEMRLLVMVATCCCRSCRARKRRMLERDWRWVSVSFFFFFFFDSLVSHGWVFVVLITRSSTIAAISFFEHAKGSTSTDFETSLLDMQPLFREALISLANLTTGEEARDTLYASAQTEGGDPIIRTLGFGPTRPTQIPITDVRMDES
ncbi:hypothetical protein B0F90DRAFT_905785 [Multifurca ochricompacta]|uniref:Uncharacterized protein n=1 Tax=Multifurca ochricompacta TaxID=376703 RepID=A0AAD4M0W0_9AGAM|nr:hypothetical protein B0F90DRAFT_905785 [Multifurca ochricompacta]